MRTGFGKWTLRKALVVLWTAVSAIPAAAQAGCEGDECDLSGGGDGTTIRVGYTQFAPYSGTSTAGLAEGYLIDLMRLMVEPLGYTLQFVAYDNPSELLESLEAGQIDATSPLSFNSDREAYGEFSQAVHTFSFDLFTKYDGPSITGFDDVRGLRVGVSEGSQAERRVRAIEGAIAVPLESGDKLLWPLLSGDVDAIAAPVEVIYYQLGRTGLGGRVERSDINLNQFPAGFLVDRTQEKLLRDLNFAIAHAQARGHIQELYDQWFRPAPEPLTQREGVVVLIAIVTVMIALIYWGWLHYGVRVRAKNATERANSLQEVLNATGATLLIADKDMRPIWWNDAYVRNYPEQVQSLEAGTTLRNLLSSRAGDPALTESASEVLPQVKADGQILELLAKGETQSVEHVVDGKVLESKGVKLSSGQYGLVAMDVTALTSAHRELQSNADRLMEANRNLSEFSHVAAHDLAGPLRSIRNLHKWILDDILDADMKLEVDVVENFEHIDRLIGRQSALIDDLLAYANSDGQGLSRVFDPKARWASVLDLCEIPKAFEVTVSDGFPLLSADPVGFDIVIRNLISNAVKHHDQPFGQISVSHQTEGEVVRILVTDDGPGIEAKYQKTIFQPFKTLKSRDHGGGTGLGLAFVERTVQKWGGQVSVTSDPENRATTFAFTVPLAGQSQSEENVVKLRTG